MLTMAQNDWFAWHSPYDDPGSGLSRRLAMVQARLTEALDRCHPGPVQVVSMCAGQGRDILGVLARHPRAGDVLARLVESDPRNAALARQGASPFTGVEVVEADAGCTDAYVGAVPADIVLACGVFGNISDDDVHRTVAAFPSPVRPGRSRYLDPAPGGTRPYPPGARLVALRRVRRRGLWCLSGYDHGRWFAPPDRGGPAFPRRPVPLPVQSAARHCWLTPAVSAGRL